MPTVNQSTDKSQEKRAKTDLLEFWGQWIRLSNGEIQNQVDYKRYFRTRLAIHEIREGELWKGSYKELEDYCNNMEFSTEPDKHLERFNKLADIFEVLSAIGINKPDYTINDDFCVRVLEVKREQGVSVAKALSIVRKQPSNQPATRHMSDQELGSLDNEMDVPQANKRKPTQNSKTSKKKRCVVNGKAGLVLRVCSFALTNIVRRFFE